MDIKIGDGKMLEPTDGYMEITIPNDFFLFEFTDMI